MKNYFYTLAFFLLSFISTAQNPDYEQAFSSFQSQFNQQQYDQIYASFSADFQKEINKEELSLFLGSIYNQYGNILSKEFVRHQPDGFAEFKTQFDSDYLSVNLALNEAKRISGLYILPFEEEIVTPKSVVNALQPYGSDIAEMLFEKVKDYPNETQLSIGVYKDGKQTNYGVIKQNDTVKPIQNHTKIFEIGSISKVFVSTVLAQLVVEKKLELSGKVNAFYPYAFHNHNELTLVNLSNHTSGVPRMPTNFGTTDMTNPYMLYGKQHLDNYLQSHLVFESAPGTQYSYSNLGTGILAHTLSLSQKKSMRELIQKRVFDKYKMKNSYTDSHQVKKDLVKGRGVNGEEVSNWDYEALFGAGGIYSTVDDLLKLAQAQWNSKNKECDLMRQPTFQVQENMHMGLGWHIIKAKSGKQFLFHNGGTGGYTSSMLVDVQNKAAIVILSNLSAFHPEMGKIDKLLFEWSKLL